MIRNEDAHDVYSTNVLCAIFEAESNDRFEVRQTILGDVQQGGDPSPFDRIQATRFAARCIEFLIEQAQSPEPAAPSSGWKPAALRCIRWKRYRRWWTRTISGPSSSGGWICGPSPG